MLIRPICGCLVLCCVVSLGCGNSGRVESYEVPKTALVPGKAVAPETVAPPPGVGATVAGDYRIMGAMFPNKEPKWFFKTSGKSDQLGAEEASLMALFKTIRFPEGIDGKPTWQLPASMKLGGPRSIFYETIRYGPNGSMELTITQASGPLYDNVKRWADQLGMPAGGEGDLLKNTKPIEGGPIPGVWVDLKGPNSPTGGPMMGGRK